MSKKTTQKAAAKQIVKTKKRTKLSQKDVPSMSLNKSLAIAQAIVDNYAGKSATPLQVAKVLNVSPSTGGFRMLCGASVAYGLTKGGYNVDKIEVMPLARRILKPTNEGDDILAKIQGFLNPRVIKEFLNKYNCNALPREDIAKNILEELGVPKEKVEYVFQMIIDQGESLGIITTLKSKKYIELENINSPAKDSIELNIVGHQTKDLEYIAPTVAEDLTETGISSPGLTENKKLKKVFITHGKNRKFIEPIKKLLKFGELEAVVSVEKTSVSQPVPDKVMNDMRSCGAAIIHVDDEYKLIDEKANEHVILNSNVLIEIGAAMALFGRRFILLVKDGVKLPSNLQGIFEVRYANETLDGDTTIRLLEAINDIKNQALPD